MVDFFPARFYLDTSNYLFSLKYGNSGKKENDTYSQIYTYYPISISVPYKEKKVTFKELIKLKLPNVASIKVLHSRAKRGALVFIEERSGTQYFDKQLSIILLTAATLSKVPGVTWGHIKTAIKTAKITKEFLIDQLDNNGKGDEEAINLVKEKIDQHLPT